MSAFKVMANFNDIEYLHSELKHIQVEMTQSLILFDINMCVVARSARDYNVHSAIAPHDDSKMFQ